MDAKFTPELIAPCGMNCGVCKAYLAYSRGLPYKKGEVYHCAGCMVRDKNCVFIKRDCAQGVGKKLRFCYECPDMPCNKLIRLSEHYNSRYGLNMIENLKMIREKGMDEFLKNQAEKYRCPRCFDVVSVHNSKCYACGYQGEKPIKRVGKAQWNEARWVPNRE